MTGHKSTFHQPEHHEWILPEHENREWVMEARCGGVDNPDMWFSPEPENGRPGRQAEFTWALNMAKLVCSECPVRYPCLNEALERYEQYGIRGGLTASQRYRIQRQKKKHA